MKHSFNYLVQLFKLIIKYRENEGIKIAKISAIEDRVSKQSSLLRFSLFKLDEYLNEFGNVRVVH